MNVKITSPDLGVIGLVYSSYRRNGGIVEIIVKDFVNEKVSGMEDKVYTNPSLDEIYHLHQEYGVVTLKYTSEVKTKINSEVAKAYDKL